MAIVEVCVVTKAWRSGAAWVAQMTAQGIAEAGGSISFVAPLAEPLSREPCHPRLVRIVVSRELTEEATKYQRIFASLRRIFGTFSAVLKQRWSTRTFIFSIPDPLIFTIPLFLILRLSRARIIFLVHDVVPHAFRFRGVMQKLELRSHIFSYAISNSLVVLTQSLRQSLIDDYKFAPGKISVIPHGPLQVGHVGECPGNGRFFLFGTFRKNKSVLEVIRGVTMARREDPQVRLLLAGEPHPHELAYWRECCNAMSEDPGGFDARVGFVPDELLPEYAASVDAFILAYREFNSQSGVGVLAGLCGRPVVGTSAGGLAELFAIGLAGVCISEPVSAENVAEAIKAFRETSIVDWRERASDAARKLAAALSWKTIGRQYLEIIRGGNQRG
jgi:glycogen(starch) synthase